MLIFKSLNHALDKSVSNSSDRSNYGRPAVSETELNTSGLVELLQRSAVEHLTTCRQLEARDFGSVATIVTTDFEALYAYKRGNYQRCLQLSTENVQTLLYAKYTLITLTLPQFIQLLDDSIVSLTALMLVVNPDCMELCTSHASVTQQTLSLYLMTQCQLKLRHSMTSLAKTLDYIKVFKKRCPVDYTLDHLTLKLAERQVTIHVRMILNSSYS